MQDIGKFRNLVWRFYRQYGRHNLPWRHTTDPYRILVSECMLQQTTVARVVPKYEQFLKTFPTSAALAEAPLGAVLRVWQGLGYNRRAKYLHAAAKAITKSGGQWPKEVAVLESLPGVGRYTARAVAAFAYNQPVVLIETNVRTVFIAHFFTDQPMVTDAELEPLLEKVLPKHRSREWYYALMDYGSYLKKTVGNESRRSQHYRTQAKFKNSDRQIRGAIIRELAKTASTERRMIASLSEFPAERVITQIKMLAAEGLLRKRGSQLLLP